MKKRNFAGLSVLFLASCMSIPAPVVVSNADDQRDMLVDGLSWQIGASNQFVHIPPGFVTDYASIPPGLRKILPKRGRYSRAAVVHDYLYWSQVCTRAQSDNILAIGMKESRVPALKNWAIYTGVDLGGSFAWSGNATEKGNGGIRVLPNTWRNRFTKTTWSKLETEMRAAGVRDETWPTDSSFCTIGNSREVPAALAAPLATGSRDQLRRRSR